MGEVVQREDVISGLPADGAHPLKELAFGSDGRLFINVGSATDACRDEHQRQPFPCPETEGPQPRAAVYEARLGGAGSTLQSLRPFATGLRNSLGLVVLPGNGRLLQAENSVDYAEATLPAEELNLPHDGSRLGWPYCVSDERGRAQVARGYQGRVDCRREALPLQGWPAHAAPLQLLAVPPAAPGQPTRPWSGRLLALWHGPGAAGNRVVAWKLGVDGLPRGPREDLLSGWPQGMPAGATVDHRGRLWVVDDRNHSVLVVAPEQPASR